LCLPVVLGKSTKSIQLQQLFATTFNQHTLRPTDGLFVKPQPGWITFSLDGTFAYPSTGEIIDAKSQKIVTTLSDEEGIQSTARR
jgi:hypothetical protein